MPVLFGRDVPRALALHAVCSAAVLSLLLLLYATAAFPVSTRYWVFFPVFVAAGAFAVHVAVVAGRPAAGAGAAGAGAAGGLGHVGGQGDHCASTSASPKVDPASLRPLVLHATLAALWAAAFLVMEAADGYRGKDAAARSRGGCVTGALFFFFFFSFSFFFSFDST
jgi:hypothetical protein